MGIIRRLIDWFFLTGPKGLKKHSDPQDATAESMAGYVAQADTDSRILPYELFRYIAGCIVLVVLGSRFCLMIETIAPYLAGQDTTVKVFGFGFVKHLIWLPALVSAVFVGAFIRLRKLKRSTDHHLGKRNRKLEDQILALTAEKNELNTLLEGLLTTQNMESLKDMRAGFDSKSVSEQPAGHSKSARAEAVKTIDLIFDAHRKFMVRARGEGQILGGGYDRSHAQEALSSSP